jgi:hypothetical protein
MKTISPVTKLTDKQSAQIGRIFAQQANVFFGQFFGKEVAHIFVLLFPLV